MSEPENKHLAVINSNHNDATFAKQSHRNIVSAPDDSVSSPKIAVVEKGVKPKKPLTAYNIFFREERRRILTKALLNSGKALSREELINVMETKKGKPHRKRHGQIGFVDLVRKVGKRWNALEPTEKEIYKKQAFADRARYKQEVAKRIHKNTQQGEKDKRGNLLFKCNEFGSASALSSNVDFFNHCESAPTTNALLAQSTVIDQTMLDNSHANASTNTKKEAPIDQSDCKKSLYESYNFSETQNLANLASSLDEECHALLSSFLQLTKENAMK